MSSDTRPQLTERLTIRRLGAESPSSDMGADVRIGLTAAQKWLPSKYFYDALGSKLFEAICHLPEYYLTRAEGEILSNHSDEIIGRTRHADRLIELGSGSAEKTRFLIEAIFRLQDHLHYLPIDISEPSLKQSSHDLLRIYPRLRMTGYVGDYFGGLRALEQGESAAGGGRTVALFLGSNIGNFGPPESERFLRGCRRILESGDALLIGADLKKSPAELIPAYDDSLGVTAAFNRNILVRLNRELDADFDISRFEHRALYDERAGRIEMHLVSTTPQRVRIAAIDLPVNFSEGETIHTENSYKFDTDQLAGLAGQTGFNLERTWFDERRRFSFNLFRAVSIS
jgi:dimethylhistidine N-methyltransferase